MRNSIVVPLALLCGLLLTRCREESVANKLQALRTASSTVVVVKDAEGVLWALPTDAIERIDDVVISLRADTLVAFGSGKGSPGGIAKELIALRARGPSGGMTVSSKSGPSTTKIYDSKGQLISEKTEGESVELVNCRVGSLTGPRQIRVAEILGSEEKPKT